jgi:hypothetical protein
MISSEEVWCALGNPRGILNNFRIEPLRGAATP